YIVVLKAAAGRPADVAAQMARAHGLGIGHIYSVALKGFSATIPDARLQAVMRDPRVTYVEQDQVFEVLGKLDMLGRPGQGGGGPPPPQPQVIPTGISRIGTLSSQTANINGNDDRVNVNVAVIDTGIQRDHPDLHVVGGYNTTSRFTDQWDDGHGHGTHVSGTIAALDNGFGVVGVAPGANLYAVKVLNDRGSGFTSWIVKGIDWVASTRTDNNTMNDIQVANMSLGGGNSPSILSALDGAVAQGVVFAVAAGNDASDCRGTSPANSTSDGVITVSALADSDGVSGGGGGDTGYGSDDYFATFSNNGRNEPTNDDPITGNGVDVIAPGVKIYSTYKGSGYATMSGTSMATPHVTGVAALYIKNNSGASPADIKLAVMTSPHTTTDNYWAFYTYLDGLNYIYGLLPWRAIGGDLDSFNSNVGYEPLVDAAPF
ncbi:MAG: S8 family serine peptidase, partial [Isosphaeraceae bacterium]|nr:S8 family serine peptidase [Isosphaeraceae bacterium]